MDIRQAKWYAQLKIPGSKAQDFEGPMMTIMNQVMHAMAASNPRIDANGHKEITLRFDVLPFDSEAVQLYDKDFLDALDMSNVTQTDFVSVDVPPWNSDPDWWQFRRFQATRSNYVTAAPGEIAELTHKLMAKWQGQTWLDPQTNELVRFEDTIIDKRKA